MFSASKRMPAAAKGTMKWALGLLRLEKGISDGLFAAVGLLLVPRGGDGCTPLREGCTKTSSDMEIQLDGKGDCTHPVQCCLQGLGHAGSTPEPFCSCSQKARSRGLLPAAAQLPGCGIAPGAQSPGCC